ncbi:Dabb family protein [Cognatiyoonia sp. IB215182]|uniref:Dabb family protein n=1 Tax=Cognatiyoonia sp. IB215182 TaxID=3097353 RepID=UPI002A0C15AF|nr:Dabb family protein [Cognatiyoonia sp. IB215182]MDX8354062.1 Dabb family protein [Cognatiyoonia sp. IB215182]
MIRHIVLLNLKDDHDAAELEAILDQLAALVGVLPGFSAFEHGPNRDLEAKSQNYPYGFIGTFEDTDALQTYAGDARHSALGARLVDLCVGGADGIMVIDLEVPG